MSRIKYKFNEPLRAGQEIAEKEIAINELPMKPTECSGMRSELVIKIGRVIIKASYEYTPALGVEFNSDPELEERAEALSIERPLIVMGPIEVIQSFFIKHLANGNDRMEPFGNNYLLMEGESPFRRSTYENGIRYLKPISNRILSLPDECSNEWENKLMKWFKYWSLAAIQKYGGDACIQFQENYWSE
jgi:hypothetical protein